MSNLTQILHDLFPSPTLPRTSYLNVFSHTHGTLSTVVHSLRYEVVEFQSFAFFFFFLCAYVTYIVIYNVSSDLYCDLIFTFQHK